MKKILLTTLLILLTGLPNTALANYGTARFGANAAFTPRNRAIAGYRNRQIQMQKAYTKALSNYGNRNYYFHTGNCGSSAANSAAYNTVAADTVATEPSRFSRDYTPRTTKRYTKNGLTYYN